MTLIEARAHLEAKQQRPHEMTRIQFASVSVLIVAVSKVIDNDNSRTRRAAVLALRHAEIEFAGGRCS